MRLVRCDNDNIVRRRYIQVTKINHNDENPVMVTTTTTTRRRDDDDAVETMAGRSDDYRKKIESIVKLGKNKIRTLFATMSSDDKILLPCSTTFRMVMTTRFADD